VALDQGQSCIQHPPLGLSPTLLLRPPRTRTT
jgi:hypothetical protein